MKKKIIFGNLTLLFLLLFFNTSLYGLFYSFLMERGLFTATNVTLVKWETLRYFLNFLCAEIIFIQLIYFTVSEKKLDQIFARYRSPLILGYPFLISILCLITAYTFGKHIFAFSPDSMAYVDTAKNLASGLGYTSNILNWDSTSVPTPQTIWPPLFPFLISLGIRLGLDPVSFAPWMSYVLFALWVFPLYFGMKNILGYRAAIFSIAPLPAFMPFLRTVSFVQSEIPFVFFVLCCFALVSYQKKEGIFWYLSIGLLAGLATLTRYVGVFLPLAIGLYWLFLYYHREISGRSLAKRGAFALMGFLFCLVPLLYRNIMITSHLGGMERPLSSSSIWQNFYNSFIVMARDFFNSPLSFPENKAFFLFVGEVIIILIFYLFIRKRTKDLFSCFKLPLFFAVTYFLFLNVLRIFVAFDEIKSRHFVPIYPFLIAFLGTWFSRILLKRKAQLLFILFFILLNVPFLTYFVKLPPSHYSNYIFDQERFDWVEENVGPRDLIIATRGWEITFFLNRPTLPEYQGLHLFSYEKLHSFSRRMKEEFSRFIIIIHKDLSERRFVPEINRLRKGIEAPEQGILKIDELNHHWIYEYHPPGDPNT